MKKNRGNKKRGAPRWGQHFLVSKDIARAVAAAAEVREGDRVLEVGPGTGILTRELLALGAHVVAVEKDPALAKLLSEEFRENVKNRTLEIINSDIRDAMSSSSLRRFFASGPYKIAANIPYYITGEVIRLALSAKSQPETVSLLVQKEVAERIARDEKESLLSLSVKAYGTPRFVRTVKAGSFNPPPGVDSAILSIKDISRKNFTDIPEESFFKVLHIGFAQKRKTLLGNVRKSAPGGASERSADPWGMIFEKLGLDPRVRSEDVPLAAWLALAKSAP